MGKLLFGAALASAAAGVGVSAVDVAAAGPPEDPHGIGVCVSQVAIVPELLDAAHLGDVVRSVARAGSSGSDLPAFVDDLRGDGPGGCGAPPGPGHLD